MIKSKIVLLSALVSCALISGCKEENKTNVSIEFMHSSVEQERQAVISKLIARFEKENPGITVKQVPVEEDAYNTKVITLSRSGSLPEVIETSHDYAKVMDKEQLIDRKAVATVISNVGEGAFYDGVLRIVRTEDGSAWTGVPVSAWIGGIWYRKDVLAKAGLEEPKNWQQLLDVAQKLNDPANKKYGIALPTAESVLTEQSFSQFALSNQANVFNAEGKITLDTPEMMQALTYYRDLAANTMPGSNDIMEVKDAFMNGTAPMAIYSTYILERAEEKGTLIVNKPQSLRDCNEKLFTAWFSDLTPETLVTRNKAQLKAFWEKHSDIILKPLDGMGGASIFRVKEGDPNLGVIAETLTEHGTRYCMAQNYLPAIKDGDKRVLVVDGEPVPYCLARIPQGGETRGNLAAGGRGEPRPLTESDWKIARQIGPTLKEKGLIFVGLDIIGDRLTEINVTSPTCIREIEAEFPVSITGMLMDAIEARLQQQ